MAMIEVDSEVVEILKKIADPFVDISPNHVIRKLLGLPPKTIVAEPKSTMRKPIRMSSFDQKSEMSVDENSDSLVIHNLRKKTSFVHPAFLTFLLDKHTNSKGNFSTGDILPFMKRFHLFTPSGFYWNPWMSGPYGAKSKKKGDRGKNSCLRTIEHFRQCRQFGCWGGRDSKKGCDRADSCIYHPDNQTHEIGKPNKCKISREVIWRRSNKTTPSSYGVNYLHVVKKMLLNGQSLPLNPLLAVFYPGENLDASLVDKFQHDFHFSDNEMKTLFI